jgi:hypothetical protein
MTGRYTAQWLFCFIRINEPCSVANPPTRQFSKMCNFKRAEGFACLGQLRPMANLLLLAVISICGLTRAFAAAQNDLVAPAHGTLSISPQNAMVGASQKLQFTAVSKGTAHTAVVWSASAGKITSTGLFTAPKVTTNATVVVTAKSSDGDAERNILALASIVVIGTGSNDPVSINTPSLPGAEVGLGYNTTLSATGGVPPYRWRLERGKLPFGFRLHASGAISGSTAVAGTYHFRAEVTDANGSSAFALFHLGVSLASTTPTTGFDGPAELPRTFIQSAMSDTPTPGNTITVNAGGDLQSALNSANCGDTIALQAGASFTGAFSFPAKSCDDGHWIVVRTNTADSLLPAEGARLTPCYAGVSSLPGRPDFHCTSTKNVLAKLVMPLAGNGPILFASGANHYRLLGLELTRLPSVGLVSDLAGVVSGGSANNLILDRVWMHGTAQDETTRGIFLENTTYVSVVDSFFTDFHCTSETGSCTDAQAILGGIGNTPMGPYKITNNFLEASGENILFGGGIASTTPADIQINQNHFFKPLTWIKGQPGYVGGSMGNPFMVKNLLELKNAQRVLVEGNIMEDSWGGFTQMGFGIVLTPKNQSGTECPICQVTDVTIRYTTISHVGGGLQIANALADNVGAALAGERYSIHDVVIDDIDGVKFDGQGLFAQVSVTAGAPLLQNVLINHVTAFPSQTLFMIGDMVATSGPMTNFGFNNSLVTAGQYPVWSTGGGSTNCAYYDVPVKTYGACFSNSTFVANAIIGGMTLYPSSSWPAGNYFPSSAASVQFVNYNGGNGGDYQLAVSSPYKNQGTDGKDLGADIDAVNSAIAEVQ